MARYLLDTNIVLRLMEPTTVKGQISVKAIVSMSLSGHIACITPQVLVEFWAVSTRPVEVNGLGIDSSTASRYVEVLTDRFDMLEDRSDIYDNWLSLVKLHNIRGKKTHDTRLAAVMKAHKVTDILTFNTDDFSVYSDINAIHPKSVV